MFREFTATDLKRYPHFDAPISIPNIEALVRDPTAVGKNSFYPLLSYTDEWQPFRSGSEAKPKKKERLIRYAARRDAYIYMHYRGLLAEKYEEELRKLGIANCPIAYRQIGGDRKKGGKCNIDFARDVFVEIEKRGECYAIALDISKFFENLDHKKIRELWCRLLGAPSLPDDHYAVFKSVTRYHYCELKDVYRRLGFLAKKRVGNIEIEGYTTPIAEMPKQLCTPSEFRAKICGGDPAYPSLVKQNPNDYGIPQGTPISDLIANLYLIDFDVAVNEYAQKCSGYYLRYSDDILLIIPPNEELLQKTIEFVASEIKTHGKTLLIKPEKTCVVKFEVHGSKLVSRHVSGPQGKNGFEYLGFRFDGSKVYVRDSTISRLYRKLTLSAKKRAHQFVKANPNLEFDELIAAFDYSLLSERFMKVRRTKFGDDYRTWTFYTYIKRCSVAFGEKGDRMMLQISNFRRLSKERTVKALTRAFQKSRRSADA